MFTIFMAGSSTANGQGQTPGYNLGRGTPIKDPTLPKGQNYRSLFPSIARECGKRGINIAVQNHAVGATALAKDWCGLMIPWFRGLLAKSPIYVISNGGVWKANTGGSVSTVAPSGTSNITGSDGVPWIYIRPATSADSTRRVLTHNEPLFDPNGLVKSFGNAAPATTGKKILIIIFGTTAASNIQDGFEIADDFRAGHISVTNYALSVGFDEIYFGYNAFYAPVESISPDLVAAQNVALAHFSGNPKVKRGVNFREEMGKLPTTTDNRVIGLHDGLHMTDAAYEKAGQLWAECILS